MIWSWWAIFRETGNRSEEVQRFRRETRCLLFLHDVLILIS
jgi:hypothetical protein